ncbi:hypothetical protein C8R42DRAFT_724420 [Lentinula raphanica]|nr:hypothetical protein C8R42DRAFT_724420 [Lentinula raphanica]
MDESTYLCTGHPSPLPGFTPWSTKERLIGFYRCPPTCPVHQNRSGLYNFRFSNVRKRSGVQDASVFNSDIYYYNPFFFAPWESEHNHPTNPDLISDIPPYSRVEIWFARPIMVLDQNNKLTAVWVRDPFLTFSELYLGVTERRVPYRYLETDASSYPFNERYFTECCNQLALDHETNSLCLWHFRRAIIHPRSWIKFVWLLEMNHNDIPVYSLSQQPTDTLLEIEADHRIRIVDGLAKALAFHMILLERIDLNDARFYQDNEQRMKVVLSDFNCFLSIDDIHDMALRLAYDGELLSFTNQVNFYSHGVDVLDYI